MASHVTCEGSNRNHFSCYRSSQFNTTPIAIERGAGQVQPAGCLAKMLKGVVNFHCFYWPADHLPVTSLDTELSRPDGVLQKGLGSAHLHFSSF